MRIVFDTNILAPANPRSKGVARILLLTILESTDHVVVCRHFCCAKPQDFAELVNPQVGGRLVPGDQEDDPVLETAWHGRERMYSARSISTSITRRF